MRYTYDIIDLKKGQIEEDNGCSLFDTEEEARKDAESTIKRLVKEKKNYAYGDFDIVIYKVKE